MNGYYFLVCVSIVVVIEGWFDGVRGCGILDVSFIFVYGDFFYNESFFIYIWVFRNGMDWLGIYDNF